MCKILSRRTATSDVSIDPAQCNTKVFRISQIVCNFILSLIGKGGVAVSILAKIGFCDELRLLDHYENVNVGVFLGCSIILITIGWLGIFAGSRNCHRSMHTNGLLLSGFIIASTAYVATISVITDYTETGNLYEQMKSDMRHFDRHAKIIDILQTTLRCCGLDGVTTWNSSHFPKSCCRNAQNESQCVLGSPYLQTNGCFGEFLRTGRYYAWILFTILAACDLLEILGIILSFLRCQIIKENKKQRNNKEEVTKNEETKEKETTQEENKEQNKEKNKKQIEIVEDLTEKSERKEAQTSEKQVDDETTDTDTYICKENLVKELTSINLLQN